MNNLERAKELKRLLFLSCGVGVLYYMNKAQALKAEIEVEGCMEFIDGLPKLVGCGDFHILCPNCEEAIKVLDEVLE